MRKQASWARRARANQGGKPQKAEQVSSRGSEKEAENPSTEQGTKRDVSRTLPMEIGISASSPGRGRKRRPATAGGQREGEAETRVVSAREKQADQRRKLRRGRDCGTVNCEGQQFRGSTPAPKSSEKRGRREGQPKIGKGGKKRPNTTEKKPRTKGERKRTGNGQREKGKRRTA